jgi:hypothetical protein
MRREAYSRAATLLEESLSLCRETGDRWHTEILLMNLAVVTQMRGDDRRALELYAEGLSLCEELEDKRGINWYLSALAEVAATRGQAEQAAWLFGAADALGEALASAVPTSLRANYDHHIAIARAALGEERFTAAWARGRAMTVDQAIACAREVAGTPDAPR